MVISMALVQECSNSYTVSCLYLSVEVVSRGGIRLDRLQDSKELHHASINPGMSPRLCLLLAFFALRLNFLSFLCRVCLLNLNVMVAK